MVAGLFNWVWEALGSWSANPRPTESILHTWLSDDQEVRLLQKGDQLDCLVIYKTNQWRVAPPELKGTIEERIAAIIGRDPFFKEDGSLVFSAPLVHHTWWFDNGKTEVVQYTDDLMIRFFDRVRKQSSLILAVNDLENLGTYFHELPPTEKQAFRKSMASSALFQKIMDDKTISTDKIKEVVEARSLRFIPIQTRVSYFKDFEVSTHELDQSTFRLTAIKLKKIQAKSRIKPATRIDRSNWAVSLLSCGQDWYGHAVIAYEGIKDGRPFLNYAHLRGQKGLKISPGRVEIYKEEEEGWYELGFPGGEIGPFPRKRYVVQEMLKKIEWEVAQQNKGETPVYFYIFGKNSYLNNAQKTKGINWENVVKETPLLLGEFSVGPIIIPHNCITWAIEMLKIANIDLPPAKYPALFTTPKEYTGNPALTRALERPRSRTLLSSPKVLQENITNQGSKEKDPRLILAELAQAELKRVMQNPSNSSDPYLSLQAMKDIQFKKEQEIKDLQEKLEVIEKKLKDFIVDEKHYEAGKQARERSLKPFSSKRDLLDLESIQYKDSIDITRLRLNSKATSIKLNLYNKKSSLTSWIGIVKAQEAYEKGDMVEVDRLRRIILFSLARQICLSLADLILEKCEELPEEKEGKLPV